MDVRWTNPEVTDQPLFIEDAAAFDERCAMNNEARLMTGQEHVIPVEKDKSRILRRLLH